MPPRVRDVMLLAIGILLGAVMAGLLFVVKSPQRKHYARLTCDFVPERDGPLSTPEGPGRVEGVIKSGSYIEIDGSIGPIVYVRCNFVMHQDQVALCALPVEVVSPMVPPEQERKARDAASAGVNVAIGTDSSSDANKVMAIAAGSRMVMRLAMGQGASAAVEAGNEQHAVSTTAGHSSEAGFTERYRASWGQR